MLRAYTEMVLEEIRRFGEAGVSVPDLAHALGADQNLVRRHVGSLFASGHIERVGDSINPYVVRAVDR